MMGHNNTVTKEINDIEKQVLLMTMSHIEYKIGKILSDFFLKKMLVDICLFVVQLMPMFYTSTDVSSEFHSQRGSPIRTLRFSCGATPANLFTTSMVGGWLLLPT